MQSWRHALELTAQFLKVAAFFAVVVLPATFVCLRRCRGLSFTARLALGGSLGFSLFVVGSWYVGLWSLGGVSILWCVQCLVAAVLARGSTAPASRAAAARSNDGPGADRRWRRLVPVPLLAGGLVQLYALQFSELPLGGDPAFHCVVGQRLLDAGRVVDTLWPLDELRLNYPIGSHLWLAVAARWTGLEVHEVFRHSFVLGLWLTGLIVASIAEELFGSARHAAAASFAFVFVSFQASLFPYTWGGLPSVLAVWQGLAALYPIACVRGVGGVAAGVLLFAGMALTHHHTLVALPGAIVLALVVVCWRLPEHRPLCRRIAFGLLGGLAVAAIYVVPLALRVRQLDATGIATYVEPFRWPWRQLGSWGPVLLVTAVVGWRAGVSGPARSLRFVLLASVAIWLCAFAALDYGGRTVTEWLRGEATTPFTPSRFLFDAQCVLSIFAGAGIVRLLNWPRVRPDKLGRATSVTIRAIGLVLLAGSIVWAIAATRPRWQPVPSDVLLPVGRWIRTNSPADAFVVVEGSQQVWTTYVCRRESPSLFIPISEPSDTPRRRLIASLLDRPGDRSWQEWSGQLGKPIYVIGTAGAESPDWEPIHVAGSLAVFKLVTREPGD